MAGERPCAGYFTSPNYCILVVTIRTNRAFYCLYC
jgi:hypothetical protein